MIWIIIAFVLGANIGVIIMSLFVAGRNGEIKELPEEDEK